MFTIQQPDHLGVDNTEDQDVLGSIADPLRQSADDRQAVAGQNPGSRKGY